MVKDGEIIGTGSLTDNYIMRVYVLPEYQGQGFGGMMMDELEEALILPSNYVKTDLEILAETSGSANVSRLYLSRSAKQIKILK